MPRTRHISVLETTQELRRIEKSLEKHEARKRITMLRLLKRDPAMTLKEVAANLGVTHHATKRWWRWYTQGGIARLQQGVSGKAPIDNDRTLHLLRDSIASGTFQTIEQVMEWLDVDHSRAKQHGPAASPATHPFTGKVIEFLTSIPTTSDPKIWMTLFQRSLAQAFWDIDRVSASMNLNCDLISPESYQPGTATLQHVEGVKIPIAIDAIDEDHAERLLNNFRRQGFPFDDYHPPVKLTYYYGETAYLAVIVLWRERRQRPISRSTIEAIEQLKPFFIYLFTDFIVRFHYMEPARSASINTLDRIREDYGLTLQQHRVLALHIAGASPDIIAESMHITADTVRSHLKTVYRKTGVHSIHEFMAQHFVSPLGIPRPK